MDKGKILTPEEILEENGYAIEDLEEEKTVLFRDPDFATAIIGVTTDNHVVYEYEKMIESLMESDEMSYEDAADYIGNNTIRTIGYITEGKVPIVLYSLFSKDY